MKQHATTGEESQNYIATIFNTRVLMVSSALFMGVLGIIATFLPQEIFTYNNIEPAAITVTIVKITGALYLGFAVLNWMARGNVIGGIYSRPVAMGNFLHFMVIAIMLIKQLVSGEVTTAMLAGSIFYSIFALCFGYILFGDGLSNR